MIEETKVVSKKVKKYILLKLNEDGSLSIEKYVNAPRESTSTAETRAKRVKLVEAIYVPLVRDLYREFRFCKARSLSVDITKRPIVEHPIRLVRIKFRELQALRVRKVMPSNIEVRAEVKIPYINASLLLRELRIAKVRDLAKDIRKGANLRVPLLMARAFLKKCIEVKAKPLSTSISMERPIELHINSMNIKSLVNKEFADVKPKGLVANVAGGEEVGEELKVDALEKLFGSSISRLIHIVDDRPKVVIALKPGNRRYDYVLFLIKVLRDIYRSIAKGIATARYLHVASEVDEWITILDVDKKIVVLDLDKDKFREKANELRSRLKEFASRGLGYLVLYVDEELLENLRDMIKEIFTSVNPDVIEVRIDESIPISNYFKIVAIYNGFPYREELGYDNDTISTVAMQLEAEYFNVLSKVLQDVDVLLKLELSPIPKDDIEKNETLHHLLLKGLAIKHLKNEGIPIEDIEVEYRLGENVIVDVYDKRNNRVIEIETLYGVGIPEVKIRKTIERVKGLVNEIWIVIPNNYLMLYGNRVFKFMKALHYQLLLEGAKLKIKLCAIDIAKYRLIPFREMYEVLCKLVNLGTGEGNHCDGSLKGDAHCRKDFS